MITKKRYLLTGLFAIILTACFSGAATAQKSVTIVGTINEDYQFMADDGQIYIVAEPEKIADLDETIGKKVKVTGIIEESEGFKIITIASYKVIEE